MPRKRTSSIGGAINTANSAKAYAPDGELKSSCSGNLLLSGNSVGANSVAQLKAAPRAANFSARGAGWARGCPHGWMFRRQGRAEQRDHQCMMACQRVPMAGLA